MTLKKIAVFFCCIVLFAACKDIKHTPKPKNIIPEDKMVEVLVDLAKLDAVSSINPRKYEERGSVGKELLFKKYQIDSLQLLQSNRYYAEHYAINKRIYEKVAKALEAESDSLYKVEEAQKANKEKAKKTADSTDA